MSGLAYFVKYLPMYWTDFRNFFHQMKAFWVQMIALDLFLIPQGRCHVNRFFDKKANSALSSLWHSETEWDHAVYMHA